MQICMRRAKAVQPQAMLKHQEHSTVLHVMSRVPEAYGMWQAILAGQTPTELLPVCAGSRQNEKQYSGTAHLCCNAGTHT
jgi:hypothetical protein